MAKTSAVPKGWIIGGIIILVVLLLFGWVAGTYNRLVTAGTGADREFANLDASYQRRLDLIPNLVQVVAGAANFEKSVIENVTAARAQVGQVKIDAGDLSDPAKVAAYQNAQAALGSSLSRLIAVAENYPQLKTSENFLSLQSQLEGTENRINVARRDYNAAVAQYNVIVRRFPSNIIANIFDFDERASFQAQPGAENVPVIDKTQFQ
jgi:LemA protein